MKLFLPRLCRVGGVVPSAGANCGDDPITRALDIVCAIDQRVGEAQAIDAARAKRPRLTPIERKRLLATIK